MHLTFLREKMSRCSQKMEVCLLTGNMQQKFLHVSWSSHFLLLFVWMHNNRIIVLNKNVKIIHI